jgi:hypothetical protein
MKSSRIRNTGSQEDSDLAGLLAAADQYGIPELKALCGEALAAGGVTRANYVELLHMAELHNCKVLKEAVFDFIAANRGGLLS